ncbi:MAG: histidine kinase [Edaphobacter sp.]|uniref:sensor histidine kinase n=1 Tax=Edaphobacter sp. TaxID=1934404 RepID=UPI00239ECCFE|nr:histidine kinase [Edaphobacter sp.]MDE1178344.1 histidine kinase [Edaphobacter sp.]
MPHISPSLILITLLVKLGVAAATSSSLARSKVFKRVLLAERRTPREVAELVAMICVPLVLGVLARVKVPNFLAADLSFETCMLLGLMVGPLGAMAGGVAMALPAVLHQEYWALPVNLAVAAVAGSFAKFVDREEVWSFSPMIDLSIYRWVTRNLRRPHLDRQVLLLVLIAGLQLCLSLLAHLYPRRYFSLYSSEWWVELLICANAPIVVGIPLKIWNAIRVERKLEEQGRLLLEARLDALQRQINPHFLFNTLNSITSLVRMQPELAREMIVKLANILRVLLKDREAFVPLRDELAFTDDYLDIEVVRFGEKLKVVKEIAPETLDIQVPGMLLQPLIENSIKHGLEPRISGGTVTLRSRVTDDGMLVIDVEDDGVGIPVERDDSSLLKGPGSGTGIGMRNVRERMEVQYGKLGSIEINSRPGRGTKVTLRMPVLEAGAVDWTENGREVLEAASHVVSDMMRRVDPDGRLSQALRSSTRR